MKRAATRDSICIAVNINISTGVEMPQHWNITLSPHISTFLGAGIFSRACLKGLGPGKEKQQVREELLQEASNLRDSLVDKLAGIREAVAGSNMVGGMKGWAAVGPTA